MKKSLEVDVTELGDILESLVIKMDKMAEPDLIDLAARLKPAAKACKAIDDYAKFVIKAKLRDRDGTRLGNMFKAVLKLIPISRFQQSKFKEDEPETYAAYCEEKDEERITFELR